MTDLHARLVAALNARLERARAADADDENTTGWWWDEPDADSPAEQHIALCRPAAVIRQTEALLRVVERHSSYGYGPDCRSCDQSWPCDDIRDVAAGEGIEVGE